MGLQGAMRISKQNAAIEKRQNKSSQQKYRIWRKGKGIEYQNPGSGKSVNKKYPKLGR